MSWYVRELVINNNIFYSHNISIDPNNIINEDSHINLDALFIDCGLDSDSYLDWLTVSYTFLNLSNQFLITQDEQDVFNYIKNGTPFLKIANNLHLSIPTINKIFNSVCSKIAFVLGEHFTDEGFISYMIEKYKFTQKQEKKLREIIIKES